MKNHWDSTKGMSVYNALDLGGDMTLPQIRDYIAKHWGVDVPDEYVVEGFWFIGGKGWAKQLVDGKVLLLTKDKRAVRASGDADLALEPKRR